MNTTTTRTKVKAKTNGASAAGTEAPVTTAEKIQIPALNIGIVRIGIRGVTSLVCHKWSEKAARIMAENQQGVAKHKKPPRNPEEEYAASLYTLTPHPDGRERYGFPAGAVKLAAVSACRFVDGVSMTHAKGAFHVLGDFVEIVGDGPHMRTDIGRIGKFGSKTPQTIYRGEFRKWTTTVTIRYNRNAITPSQLANLLNVAGFAVGIGEWRPEKNGQFGMFEVVPGVEA